MGTIRVYTAPNEGSLQSFNMGTWQITDLEAGVDYVENRCVQKNIGTINKDVWCLSLTLPENHAGVNNLSVNKNNQPVVQTTLINQTYNEESVLCSSNNDLSVTALTERPDDWDIHWRDKYTRRTIVNLRQSAKLVVSDAIVPPTQGGIPQPVPFEENTFYPTNQSRYLFWTLGGCYFAIQNNWSYDSQWNGNVLCQRMQVSSYGAYAPGTQNWSIAQYSVDGFRVNGLESNYLFTETADRTAFKIRETYSYDVSAASNPRLFCNFIQFEYPITLTGGEVIHEEMVGLCVWQENLEQRPVRAQIVAFSKAFWTAGSKPPYTGPTSGIQGGGGLFNYGSDSNPFSVSGIATAWNAVSSYTNGAYGKYVVSDGSDQPAFRKFLTRIMNVGIWSQLQNLFINPTEGIICCHAMPLSLCPDPQTATHIDALGVNISEGLTCHTFTSDMTYKNVGEIEIKELTGSFADYTNTTIALHLPYIGTVSIDVAGCMNGFLKVEYISEAFSGDCTAFVTVTDREGIDWTRYEFKGNCAKRIPLTTYRSYLEKGIGIATNVGLSLAGLATSSRPTATLSRQVPFNAIGLGGRYNNGASLMTGNILGAQAPTATVSANAVTVSDIIGTTHSLINDSVSAFRNNGVLSNNASGGSCTSPSLTQCFALISRPVWSNPERYAREASYPSDIGGQVKDFSGLIQVASIETDGIEATDIEKSEIIDWMKAGVYLDGTLGE